MRRTNRQTVRRTLTDLERARQRRTPVTIAALVTERDDNGRPTGRFTETVRTIEPHTIHTTAAGALVVVGIGRSSGEYLSLRVDRIRAYQAHRRMRFTHEVPPTDVPEPTTVAAVIARELARDDADYAGDDYTALTLAA